MHYSVTLWAYLSELGHNRLSLTENYVIMCMYVLQRGMQKTLHMKKMADLVVVNL